MLTQGEDGALERLRRQVGHQVEGAESGGYRTAGPRASRTPLHRGPSGRPRTPRDRRPWHRWTPQPYRRPCRGSAPSSGSDSTSTARRDTMASHNGVGSLRSNSSHRAAMAGSMADPCTTRTRPVSTSSTAIFENVAPAAAAPCSAKAAATSEGDAAAASRGGQAPDGFVGLQGPHRESPTGSVRERGSKGSDMSSPTADAVRRPRCSSRPHRRNHPTVRGALRQCGVATCRCLSPGPARRGSPPARRSRRPAPYPAGRREWRVAASVCSDVAASRRERRCPNCR